MDTKRDDATVARVAAETAQRQAADHATANAAPISEGDRQRREAAAQVEAQAARSAAERTKGAAERAGAAKADDPLPISKMPLAEQGPARWEALRVEITAHMAALDGLMKRVLDLIHDANRDGDTLAARERAADREREAAKAAEIAGKRE